jgi:hypothetical protein
MPRLKRGMTTEKIDELGLSLAHMPAADIVVIGS